MPLHITHSISGETKPWPPLPKIVLYFQGLLLICCFFPPRIRPQWTLPHSSPVHLDLYYSHRCTQISDVFMLTAAVAGLGHAFGGICVSLYIKRWSSHVVRPAPRAYPCCKTLASCRHLLSWDVERSRHKRVEKVWVDGGRVLANKIWDRAAS